MLSALDWVIVGVIGLSAITSILEALFVKPLLFFRGLQLL